tara:strand:+ start:20421 stop:20636 length:216 start_codon:yes stop_codon:yes gene_type:complete
MADTNETKVNRLAYQVRRATLAAELAGQFCDFMRDDENWAELLAYAVSNAEREAAELRRAFDEQFGDLVAA